MGLYIRCCYYVNDKNLSITCEDCIRQFESKREKRQWIKTYCETNWSKCVYASDLNQLYERIENMDNKNQTIEILNKQNESKAVEIDKLKKQLGNSRAKYQKKENEIIKQLEQARRDEKAIKYLADARGRTIIARENQIMLEQARNQSLNMMLGFLVDKLGISEINSEEVAEFYGQYEVNWELSDKKIIIHKKERTTDALPNDSRATEEVSGSGN